MIATLAQSAPPPRYEFSTLAPWIDEPGTVTIAGLAAVVLVAAVVLLYWRERFSLSPLKMLPLLLLRLSAVIGVVLFALAPEKRDAQQQTRSSRVLLLVDDSLSMALPSAAADESQADQPNSKQSRAEAMLELLKDRGLLDTLRESHDVHVAPIDDPRATAVFRLRSTGDEPVAPEFVPTADLAELTKPRAVETRLGDAMLSAASFAASGPLAGVVLLSDGQSSVGANPELAATALGELGAAVHTIGLGSEAPAKNLAVRDVMAPRRVYPKDEAQITAVLEPRALNGLSTNVTLSSRVAGDETTQGVLLESKMVGPFAEEEIASAAFTVRPDAVGRYEYVVHAAPLAGEHDQTDNTGTVEVQVVDRRLSVLLIAGGPTRDYHFLRDQLRRDDAFEVDVLLQSAPAVISQDADKVLEEFPKTEEALADYDLIVAFDADWTKAPRGAIQAIDQCVSQRGAGFVYSSGPVNTPRWLRESVATSLLPLLPVKPKERPVLLGEQQRTAPRPQPVKLTRAGREAPPMWVRGNQQVSSDFWEQQFPGFYSTAEVDSVKPAAMVYAQTSPPGGDPRVVFAEQFYGAGRCFYIGAPELWRLRSEDPAAMRALYTKLLQHLSQGRLLAGSMAGSLLFERDRYNVGDTLTLRASFGESDSPAPEELAAQVQTPNGHVLTLPMQQAESSGVWSAGLRSTLEGEYRASLTLSAASEPLSAKATVRVPALERSRTERDAEQLLRIARQSGGGYYPTFEAVLSGDGELPSLADAIPSRTETLIVYGAPDEQFAKLVARWLLGLIAGCLFAEWTLRRFLGLA